VLCLNDSDVDLLGDLDGVVDLDAKVPNRAFNLRVPEQKLDRSQISGAWARSASTTPCVCAQ